MTYLLLDIGFILGFVLALSSILYYFVTTFHNRFKVKLSSNNSRKVTACGMEGEVFNDRFLSFKLPPSHVFNKFSQYQINTHYPFSLGLVSKYLSSVDITPVYEIMWLKPDVDGKRFPITDNEIEFFARWIEDSYIYGDIILEITEDTP